jgi:surface polysaccharide O-acyltransferase-like enzyme
LLYNFASIAGIIAVWYGADPVVHWCMNKKWFRTASTFSFFIYGFHIPFMAYLMHFAFMYLHNLPNYRLLCYLLVPALTVLLSIALAQVIRRFAPPVYKPMTGGRGL